MNRCHSLPPIADIRGSKERVEISSKCKKREFNNKTRESRKRVIASVGGTTSSYHGRMDLGKQDLDTLRAQTKQRLGPIKPIRVGDEFNIVSGKPSNEELRERADVVVGEIFNRTGNKHIKKIRSRFYPGKREWEFAATIIQCFWRFNTSRARLLEKRQERYEERMTQYIKIQGLQRCILAKKELQIRKHFKFLSDCATLIARSWRGFIGRRMASIRRAYVERLEVERLSSITIQCQIRRFFVITRIFWLNAYASKIEKVFNGYTARCKTNIKRKAVQKIGEFGRFILARSRFLGTIQSAAKINLFLRATNAKSKVTVLKKQKALDRKEFRRISNATRIQKLFRGIQGRGESKRQKTILLDCETALANRPELKLLETHLIKNVHSISYLNEMYREAILNYPEASSLLYAKSIATFFQGKNENGAKGSVAQANALDPTGHEREIVRYILRRSLSSHKVPAHAYLQMAVFIILTDPSKEEAAIRLFDRVIQICETNQDEHYVSALTFADKYLMKYKREISSGMFSNKVFDDDCYEIDGVSGNLSVWQRGLNFRFVFSFTQKNQTSKGRNIKVKRELIYTREEVWRALRFLERMPLSQSCNQVELRTLLTSMLILNSNTLTVNLKQQPFPKRTHFTSTGVFLSVVACPWYSSSPYLLDLELVANAVDEQYSIRIPQNEVDELFADETLLLAARTKPGWRNKCEPLITRLVSMLELKDNQIPQIGDIVISINPIWKEKRLADLNRGFELEKSNWLRLGKVVDKKGLEYQIMPYEETKMTLEFIQGTSCVYKADLFDLRLAEVEYSNDILRLLRFTTCEIPDISKPFRNQNKKRTMFLNTASRKEESRLNVNATKIQKIHRGRQGRQEAMQVFRSHLASRISRNWRKTLLLKQRVKHLAFEYRCQRYSNRIQLWWRRIVASWSMNLRIEKVFGLRMSMYKANTILDFRISGGSQSIVSKVLARHCFEFTRRGFPLEKPNEMLLEICAMYKNALEEAPTNVELTASYLIARATRELLGEETPDILLFPLDSISLFSSTKANYFRLALNLYSESPLAAMQYSLMKRLVFKDLLQASAYARLACSLIDTCRDPQWVWELVEENNKICILECLRRQMSARRIQRHYRQNQNHHEIISYGKSLKEMLRLLNFAWKCHVEFVNPQTTLNIYQHVRKVCVGRTTWKDDIECCIGLLVLASSVELEIDHDDKKRCLATLKSKGPRFWKSRQHRLRIVTEYKAGLSNQTNPHVFLNYALLLLYGSENAVESNEALNHALSLDPTSIPLAIVAENLKAKF